MPYLLEAVRGFGTLLQRVWDHDLQGTQVKLVLNADVETLERRRDLLLGELRGATRVYLVIFAGNPISDRGVAARVERGELLHFALGDLF